MKIEKGVISGPQLIFLIIGLLQASTLTAAFITGITKTNTWIVLLAGFIIILPLLLIYTSLSKKFPNKNLIEIIETTYGRYLGKIISILYIYFFWYIVSANLRFTADFFSTYLFAEVDISVFIIIFTIACIYTLKKGLEVIARASFILSVLSIFVFILISILIIKDIHLSNFLPLFQINSKEFIQGTNLMISIPFGEIVVFLMIFPYINNTNKVKKYAFGGLIVGGIFFLSSILENIAVLGNLIPINFFPSYQVAKLINVGEVITRMEILIALVLLFNEFVKICIFYYAVILSIAQFFKLRSYKPLVVPIGIISVIFSITMFDSPVEHAYIASSIYPIYVIPFIVLFPSISLIISWIRKLGT
ncbi:spore gernimation protein [Clostridium autoethanogenum]|uniref:Predicted spore germination protein n=2 Tax=Clostridium TaxID=1485 RepID=D8GU45_CLOLD|nr:MULTISPECIES: endospore germination permease [Clostridium]ADK14708.1 predicted spore germination protein [Clostridium ljungdahlii DSM 13528]OAA85945.1 Spore germination protein YndE [Clostridium ljungdahlii DSM 13528]RMC99974.1 spore gernimation protein [Clostridium autoethanogenum]